MKLFLTAALAGLMTLTLSAAGLSGTWKGAMETQGGKTQVTITINPGTALAGKVDFEQYAGTIQEGKLDGDKISFAVNIGPGTVAFDGTVAGNEMRLNVTGTQGDKYVLTCQRQQP